MITINYRFYVAVFLTAFSVNAAAVSVEIAQSSLFLSVSGTTYQDDQQGYYDPVYAPKTNSFAGGFDISYIDNLDANNLGEMTWRITNNTGGAVTAARFTGFLDADLGNVFFENFGLEQGSVNTIYDSWEIDDSDPSYGDIYQHLQGSGALDNSNSLPAGSLGDVALALGFDISDWLAHETIVARFLITGSQVGPAGLSQFDSGDDNQADGIYFSASIENIGVVPIPGSGGLMLSGLVLLAVARYRGKYRAVS
jgi:hypothetical protein